MIQYTEKAIVVQLTGIDAYLKPASHFAMHSFPQAAPTKPEWWSLRNFDK
jgi:hypothetical protein